MLIASYFENFSFQRDDLSDGRIRLNDVRITPSAYEALIVEAANLPAGTQVFQVYLSGSLTKKLPTDRTVSDISGRSVHVVNAGDVDLTVPDQITVGKDTKFFFFDKASPGVRTAANLKDNGFKELQRASLPVSISPDSTSSTRSSVHRDQQRHLN